MHNNAKTTFSLTFSYGLPASLFYLIHYIEKNFSVCPNKEVIEKVRTHVNTYEDSIRYHNEMIQMAAIKDSMANSIFKEANEIKKKINQK